MTMATKRTKSNGAMAINSTATIDDKSHHIAGSFLPQTPLASGFSTPVRSPSPTFDKPRPSIFLRWAIEPGSALKLLLLPIILYANWELVSPYVKTDTLNPFGNFFLLSGLVPDSKPDDPRYQKTYWDLGFLAYHVVFFSFVRQSLLFYLSRPLAKYFGLKRESKVDRFGEQTYALLYFLTMGLWGFRIMKSLPTFWYNTTEFWLGYPHWDMKPELKRYYLMQFSYWLQQLLVMVLGLEKPRKDFHELVAHHIVTLWLVGWSYLVNLTFIGNAVYMSMDLPDAFFAFSKLLNYIQWNTAKIYAFIVFVGVWTYFRHYLNLKILWSVWFEEPVMTPAASKLWSVENGTYLVGWMQSQIFIPLLLLQFLNLFWYSLIVKILIRAIMTSEADDDRSDDEGDDEPSKNKKD
ncbi:TLC domain-containing protein [Crepidotus variabilis]|uniref:TLC domain-containing protein n=1 Tax=Crepidotus variabilis TaxID=179855 RepID=A0A9P6ERS9_9AGAR|nr:TLC domain-containing protein [Crepidotus variabilis]